jgi:hypothetical protein
MYISPTICKTQAAGDAGKELSPQGDVPGNEKTQCRHIGFSVKVLISALLKQSK